MFFKSKWIFVLLSLTLILGLLLMLGRKSVHTEIWVEAEVAELWAALTKPAQIHKWNNVLVPIDGTLKEGHTIQYEFYQNEGGKAAVISARVKKVETSQLINQSGGIPGLLTFDHKYIIEPQGAKIKVTIHEEYRGIMVPFWNPAPVEKAYTRLLQSLKVYVEQKS